MSLTRCKCSLPVWLLIAAAIGLDSPGPVFFFQERGGLRGRHFRFYKFRSMRTGSDRVRADVQHLNQVSGPVFKVRRDPRTTRVGRLLRRTSLDELPQLVNVIRGDMSLVGPRPPLPDEVAQYRSSDTVRLGVKPGLTLAGARTLQLRLRHLDGLRPRVRIRALVVGRPGHPVRTAWAVLSCRGAY